MTLTPNDLISYPSRATAAQATTGLQRILGAHNVTDEDNQFIRDTFQASEEGGVDFAFAIAHAMNETDWLQDPDYTEGNNGWGIGHDDNATTGTAFPSKRACARFYVVELLLKMRRPIPASLSDARSYAPKRYDEIVRIVGGSMGPFPNVERIKDLNARFGPNNREAAWMTDATGPQSICAKGNALLPNLPSQGHTPSTTTTPPPGGEPVGKQVAMFIDKRLTSRDLGFLDGGTDIEAFITIHNNGNYNSDRYDEAKFVQSGGGADGVLYHGSVDSGGLCQIEKFDRRGVHAGNTIGNRISLAFEMCEGSEPWAKTEENMAQTLAAIILGDSRLDFGRLKPENFSLDRVVEHRDWGRAVGIGGGLANPNCPRRVIAEDHAIDTKILPRARAIVAAAQGGTTPTPIPTTPYVKPDVSWMGDDIEKGTPSDHRVTFTVKGEEVRVQIFGAEREYEVLKPTWRYQKPESGGPKVGPRLAVREEFTGHYIATVGKTRWVCTRWGSWILASYLTPRVSVRAA
jgi:hypothetical protein